MTSQQHSPALPLTLLALVLSAVFVFLYASSASATAQMEKAERDSWVATAVTLSAIPHPAAECGNYDYTGSGWNVRDIYLQPFIEGVDRQLFFDRGNGYRCELYLFVPYERQQPADGAVEASLIAKGFDPATPPLFRTFSDELTMRDIVMTEYITPHLDELDEADRQAVSVLLSEEYGALEYDAPNRPEFDADLYAYLNDLVSPLFGSVTNGQELQA